MSSHAGLETLYSTVSDHFKSHHDALVCCLHWNLVQNGYKCTGSGEETFVEGKKSELLPLGWNQSDAFYVLRYQPTNGDEVHILKIVRVESTLLVHILRVSDDRLVEISVETTNYINADKLQDFDSVFKNLDRLNKLVSDKLLKPLSVKTGSSTSSSTQTRSTTDTQTHTERTQMVEDDDPLRVPTRRLPMSQDPRWEEPSGPFSVGRGDLDPFSGASGGMLMDPFRGGVPAMDPTGGFGMPGRLPRGSVPPGARFDPIGPGSGPGRNPMQPFSGAPDPDHLPPPGYDDMFM